MALSPEEERELARLKAKFGAVPPPPAAAAPAAAEMTLDEMKAKFGPVPPPPQAEEAPPEATTLENIRHAAGGLPQAAADVADMPYNVSRLIKGASDWVPASVKQGFRTVAPTTAAALDTFTALAEREGAVSEKPGFRQAKEVLAAEQENVAPWAEYARTGLEWGAGGIPKLTGKAARAVPDLLAGAGAATGQAAGEYAFGEEGSTAGELIGGITGVIAALRTGRVAGLSRDQRLMLEAINEMYDDPADAIAEITRRVEAGEVGTVADLSRSLGVADVENYTNRAMEGSRVNQARVAAARERQIFEDVTNPLDTGADPTQAQYATEQAIQADVRGVKKAAQDALEEVDTTAARQQRGLDATREQAEQNARRAETQAQVADETYDVSRETVDPGGRPDEYSSRAAGNYNAAETAHADNVSKPAWKAFDEGPRVETAGIRQGVADYLDAMDPDLVDTFTSKYPGYWKTISNWGDDVSPAGVQDVVARMKRDINEAVTAGKNGPDEKRLGEIVDIMEEQLQVVSPEYRAAVAATKEGYDRFGPGYVGDVRRANEPETLLTNLGLQGDRGAATARLVAESRVPELQQDVTDYIRAQAVRKGDSLSEDFLVQYEAVLDNLPPAVRQEISELIAAKTNKAATLKQAAAADRQADKVARQTTRQHQGLEKATGRQRDAISRNVDRVESGLKGDTRGQFADRPASTVDRLLQDPDGADELRQLMDEMQTVGEVDSFKAMIRDRLENKLFDVQRVPGEGTITSSPAKAAAYRQFKELQESLVEAGVITQADAVRMEAALERGVSSRGLRQASKAKDVTRRADEHINLLSSAGAAAFLGPMPGAYSLMVGGAVRRSLNRVLRGKLVASRVKVLDEYLTNPAKYLADLHKAKTPGEVERQFLTKLVGAAQAAELLGGE